MLIFFKTWVEQIAVTVIIASIFEMILPNGNLKKYIKIILGIYILFSIISPFVNKKDLYSFDMDKEIDNYTVQLKDHNSSEITKKVDKNLEDVYISVFEEKITKTIEKYGFNVRSILVDASFNTNEDDMGIRKINIVLSSKNENFKNKNKDKNKDTDTENKKESTNEKDENYKKIEIEVEVVNEVIINASDESNKNPKEKDNTIKISQKEINDLKKYLSDYYDIEKNIFEIKAY